MNITRKGEAIEGNNPRHPSNHPITDNGLKGLIPSHKSTNEEVNKLKGERKERFPNGTIFGAILGIAATLFYQYFHGILRQPRLTSKAVSFADDDFNSLEKQALFISTENLHAGVSRRQLKDGDDRLILHAGYRNFRESWGRDFGFAAYGLLALGDTQTVKDTLEAFFLYQTPEGQLPVKLRSMSAVRRFMHSLLGREQPLGETLTPKYLTAHRTASLDSQALLIIAACNTILQTEDRDYAHRMWKSLQLAMNWFRLHSKSEDHLLHQKAFADWADSVARKGTVLYTNVVYWQALRQMENLAAYLNDKSALDFYRQYAADLRRAIAQRLWRPNLGYFATSEHLDNFSSAGNLLAVAWGLAEEAQAHSILDFVQTMKLADPVPTQAAYPAYKNSLIAIENRVGRLANYHTEGAWLWIGAWHVIALFRMERYEEARNLLARISGMICRDQQVHEVYGLDGMPLSSFWYTSEAPLTWNAAMVIYAFQVFEGN